MKKVLKNILKWLACVFLSFTVVFTVMHFDMICEGTYYEVRGKGELSVFFKNEEELMDGAKFYEEITDLSLKKSEEGEKTGIISRSYEKYPAGTARLVEFLSRILHYGELTITALALGMIIGTAVYILLLDKEKNRLITIFVVYIISVVILGFIEGIQTIYGDVLIKWVFPEEYILPVTILFAILVAIRIIQQKDIAKKLNKKLKVIKEEKSK